MRPLTLAALVLFSIACGDEGNLTLRLVRAEFDDPFRDVDTFQVHVLDASSEVGRFAVDAQEETFDLGLVSSGLRRVEIFGLSKGTLVSQGKSRLLTLESGVSVEELVPYATQRVTVALPADRGRSANANGVDGSLDDWQASPSLVLEERHWVFGPKPSSADLRVELMLAWDAERLHFALRVDDDCPALREGQAAGSCGAATTTERIFLGFDGAADGGQFGPGDHWIELKATRLWVRKGDLQPSQISVILAPRPDKGGWVMEGSLLASALKRQGLDPTKRVGFELMVVDEDPGQAEPTVLRWSGGSHPMDTPTPPGQMGTIGLAQVK